MRLFSFVVYSLRLLVETCVCLHVFSSKLSDSHIWFTAGLHTHAYLSLFYCARCWFFSSCHSGILRQEVCRKWWDISEMLDLVFRVGCSHLAPFAPSFPKKQQRKKIVVMGQVETCCFPHPLLRSNVTQVLGRDW